MKKTISSIWQSDKKWVLSAIIFFILFKFFLVYILWQNRTIAPEPDDSYTYIAHIASVLNCSNFLFCSHPFVSIFDFSGFTYLSYRVILGSIAKIFLLTPESAYHLSFYIGSFLLPFCLIPFIRSFTANAKLIALTLFFLAFLHGNGESHGFFWIVPSFLSLLIFFLLAGYILGRRFPIYILILLLLIYTFSHPISVYLCLVFPLYFILNTFFTGSIDVKQLQRITFIVSTILFLTLCQSYYLKKIHGSEYYSINVTLNHSVGIFDDILNKKIDNRAAENYSIIPGSHSFLTQKISTLHAAYFKWLLPHWLFILPFISIFILLIYKKEFSLISFYFATLIFYIISTFLNEFGFRSALILWPVTFIILSFGTWHFYHESTKLFNNKLIHRIVLMLFFIVLFLFFILNIFYSLSINSNLSSKANYTINNDYFQYIDETIQKDKTINLHPILSRTSQGEILLKSYVFLSIKDSPDYIITIHKPPFEYSPFIEQSSKLSSFVGLGAIMPPVINQIDIPSHYSLDKKFGMIWIYKK